MNTEFPTPTRLLIEDVLGIGRVEDAHIEQHLRDYFLDSTMQVLLQDVHSEYSDLSEEEEELSAVFNQIKASDPDFKVPFIYAQISGLNQSIVVLIPIHWTKASPTLYWTSSWTTANCTGSSPIAETCRWKRMQALLRNG